MHIPWDKVDDYAALAAYARAQGVEVGTVNANVFQDDDYKLGSVCHPDPRVRRKALAHLLECVDIMDATGSRDLKLWFADGTNYPGQDSIAARQDRLAEALDAAYRRLSASQRLILEYKLFEPAFYTTDVPDWGTAYAHCLRLGERAKVCVDTGHHAPGTNIEFIVAVLLRAGKLGAFDFNSRFYADDDLMVGAADPFQLFRILFEVVLGRGLRRLGRHRVHARPVPQHRAEDPGPDPLGHERPGGHGQGAAGGHRPRWPPPSSPATCSARTPRSWMPTTPTSARCSRNSARTWAWTPTRSRPTTGPATARRSSRTGSAAPPRAGATDPHPRGAFVARCFLHRRDTKAPR